MGAPLFRCLLLTVLVTLPVEAEPSRISGRVVLPADTQGAQVELHRLDPSPGGTVHAEIALETKP